VFFSGRKPCTVRHLILPFSFRVISPSSYYTRRNPTFTSLLGNGGQNTGNSHHVLGNPRSSFIAAVKDYGECMRCSGQIPLR